MVKTRKKEEIRNIGLLILRMGLGIMFILHGYPKMFGGPEMWTEVGMAMQYLGIDFAPMFFGFMAGVAEFFGGIFILLGLFFTPSVVLLFLVMLVASVKNIATAEGLANYSHSIELAVVFLSLVLIGAGKYSLDKKLQQRRRRSHY